MFFGASRSHRAAYTEPCRVQSVFLEYRNSFHVLIFPPVDPYQGEAACRDAFGSVFIYFSKLMLVFIYLTSFHK